MVRRWLVLLLACLIPLQSVHAAWHDYSNYSTHDDGMTRFLYHSHVDSADHDEHGNLDPARNGDSQHDGKAGHSHAPHISLLSTLTVEVAPAPHPRPPASRPPIYLSAILEQPDRPPLPARR